MAHRGSWLANFGTAALAGVCGLAVALTPNTAHAQNALGDGRALDRNLQQGSGGVNTRVRDIDAQIRFANAIVTGNAPGGLSFRDNVGYIAPGEFTGRLGSNDLFPFLRDAAPVTVSEATGFRGTQALRYQFGVTTGTGVPPEFQQPLVVDRAGRGVSGGEVASGLRSTADYLTRQSLRPVVVGQTPLDPFRTAAITASPLTGVRAVEIPRGESIGFREPEMPLFTQPLGQPLPGGVERPGLPEGAGGAGELDAQNLRGEAPGAFSGLGTPPQRQQRERAPSAFTGLEPVPRGARSPRAAGTSVDLSMPSSLAAPQSLAQREVTARLGQELDAARTTAPGALIEPPRDAARPDLPPSDLEQRLESLRRRLAGEPGAVAAPLLTPEGEEPLARPPLADPDRPATEVRPGDGPRAGEPAPEDRRRDERRREGMRQAGILDPSRAVYDQQTIDALRRSRITVRDLRTPTVADNLVYAENMAAGQSLLAQGRYFDAEERFVRAGAAIPGEAMASVGRIHAQIGAGLFMSASMNLRTLLSTTPELVPVRYAPDLLPSSHRWGAIRDQLVARVAGTDASAARAAAVLLAYLGYQYGDATAVSQGVARLRSGPEMQIPSEAAFVNLISGVWTDAPAEPEK